MAELNDFVRWQMIRGAPIVMGDRLVTPQARALVVNFPQGGFVWNRPTSLLVTQDGRERLVLIPDMTRLIQVGLIGMAFSFALIGFFFGGQHK